MMPITLASADFERFVAEEAAAVQGLFQGFQRIVAEQLDLLPAARLDAVLLHLLAKALPIEGQVAFGGQGFEQFGREAVGLEHVGGLGAGDDAAPLLLSSASKIRSMRSRPASMVARKLASSFSITPATAVDGLAQLGIRVLHQFGHLGPRACAGTARGRPSGGRPARRGASSRRMT